MDDRSEETTQPRPTGKVALTPEMREQLKRSQRRNMIGGLVFGLILAVLGFFAAQNIKSGSDGSYLPAPAAVEEIVNVWS